MSTQNLQRLHSSSWVKAEVLTRSMRLCDLSDLTLVTPIYYFFLFSLLQPHHLPWSFSTTPGTFLPPCHGACCSHCLWHSFRRYTHSQFPYLLHFCLFCETFPVHIFELHTQQHLTPYTLQCVFLFSVTPLPNPWWLQCKFHEGRNYYLFITIFWNRARHIVGA